MSRGLGDVYKRQPLGFARLSPAVDFNGPDGPAAVSYTHLTLPTTPYV
ncbi:hypothetical protein JMUB7552_27510 [Staphylococcus aureus]